MAAFSTQEVLERLEILWRKLEDEGRYVSSNTVSLAIDEIQRQATNPDRMPKHIALDRSSNSFLFEALVKAQGRDWRRIKREVRKAIKAERLASRCVEKQ